MALLKKCKHITWSRIYRVSQLEKPTSKIKMAMLSQLSNRVSLHNVKPNSAEVSS